MWQNEPIWETYAYGSPHCDDGFWDCRGGAFVDAGNWDTEGYGYGIADGFGRGYCEGD